MVTKNSENDNKKKRHEQKIKINEKNQGTQNYQQPRGETQNHEKSAKIAHVSFFSLHEKG